MTTELKEGASVAYRHAFDAAKQRFVKPESYLEKYQELFAPYFDKEIAFLELGIFEGDSLDFFSKILPKAKIFGIDIRDCDRKFDSPNVKTYQGSQEDPALFKKLMDENGVREFDVIIDDCSHIGSLTLNSFNLLFPFLKPGGIYVVEDWATGYWSDWPDGKKFAMRKHLAIVPRLPKWLREKVNRLPIWVRSLLEGARTKYFKGSGSEGAETATSDGDQAAGASSGLPARLGKTLYRATLWIRSITENIKSHQYGIPGFIKQLVDEVAMDDITGEHGLRTHIQSKIDYLHIYSGIVIMRKSASMTDGAAKK